MLSVVCLLFIFSNLISSAVNACCLWYCSASDARYRYEDRIYHRGYFRPTVRHIRVYEESDSGDNYYYPIYNRVPRRRVIHPEYIEERYIGSGGYRNLRYRDGE